MVDLVENKNSQNSFLTAPPLFNVEAGRFDSNSEIRTTLILIKGRSERKTINSEMSKMSIY